MEELYKQIKARFDEYHYPAHDFKHVERASVHARRIAEAEGYDPLEAEVAGLLHDVGRTIKNLEGSHAHAGAPIARELLDKYTDFSEEVKERITQSVYVHSDLHTEGKLNNIVQDADKLDGIGALGVMRAYLTFPRLPDFDPDDLDPAPGQYGKFRNIHEAIALQVEWYNMLYTNKAKDIGRPAYEFMKQFMAEFKREVEVAK
jgi:uncharacterized protein